MSPLSFEQDAKTINGSRECPFFDDMEGVDSNLRGRGQRSGPKLGGPAVDEDA